MRPMNLQILYSVQARLPPQNKGKRLLFSSEVCQLRTLHVDGEIIIIASDKCPLLSLFSSIC